MELIFLNLLLEGKDIFTDEITVLMCTATLSFC